MREMLRRLMEIKDTLKLLLGEVSSLKQLVLKILRKEDLIMANLDALTVQIQANVDAEASAVVLIQGLAKQLADIATDPVAVAALASKLNDSAAALAAAVVANTLAE